jgi:uncharacterized membrane protein
MEEKTNTTWRATLTPHRSLTRKGHAVLMGVIIGANLAGGVFFMIIGAWPVISFLGIDVLLVWLAFRRNFADARRAERIEITAHELVLERLSERRPRHEQRFARRWVRVELDVDAERELIGPLYLRFQGKRTEIASFLGGEERQAFARALKAALANPAI